MALGIPWRRGGALVTAQVSGVFVMLVMLAFAPPTKGAYLLLAFDAHAQVARIAIDHDALLLGPGPVPGSLIVFGERSRLFMPAWRAGIVMLAAPSAVCGKISL